jgi:hypothetical protein
MKDGLGISRGTLQLKPSKWPFKMRSPIGEGALRGLDAVLIVADRRGLLRVGPVGVVAELGGGFGGDTVLTF